MTNFLYLCIYLFIVAQIFNESATTAVAEFRSKQEVPEHSVIDRTVLFDGTWAKRGHSSHYGVQAVILNWLRH